MVSSTVSALLRLAGWSYLPDFATRQLLSTIYRLMSSPPAPNTPQFIKHYRIAFAIVVLGFLSYNLVEALRVMEPSFYEILQVPFDVGEEELKQAFKTFARRHHPDRGGSEDLFIMGKMAQETLKDPVVRFAYNRFGSDVVQWTHCSTIREFLRHGLLQSSGYYIATGAGLVIWSSIQKSTVTFWRYILFLAIFLSELSLILTQQSTSWSTLFPHRTPHQNILFLHQLFLFLSVALSKVAPVIFPTPLEENWDSAQFKSYINNINALAMNLNREVFGMLHTNLRSVHPPNVAQQTFANIQAIPEPDPQTMELLGEEMENMIIEAQIPRGPVWDAAVTRGKMKEEWRLRNGMISPVSSSGSGDGRAAEQSRSRLPSPSPSPERKEFTGSPAKRKRVDSAGGYTVDANGTARPGYVRGRSLSC